MRPATRIEALRRLPPRGSFRITPLQAFITLLLVIDATLIGLITKSLWSEVTGALVYVVSIILSGAYFGLGASLLAALAASLLFNFYLAEPILTFRLATGSDIAPLIIFNICVVISGIVAGRLKDQAHAASVLNSRLAALLDTSQALQRTVRLQDIATLIERGRLDGFGRPTQLFLLDGKTVRAVGGSCPAGWAEAAQGSIDGPVEPGAGAGQLTIPLHGAGGRLGVMVIEGTGITAAEIAYMNAVAGLFALAVERTLLAERIVEADAVTRTEKLKSALLSSVSHDLRTPLTTISASASSLIDYQERLDPDTSRQLLQSIVDECERLDRYTANLLEMSRLESGEPLRPIQTVSVDDVLSAVVRHAKGRAADRRIACSFADPALLVDVNPALFELVLTNVIDNAIVYSEDGSRIEVESHEAGGTCIITIADEGIGVPAEELNHIFLRFHRVARPEPSPRGSGLGLAIAKGFVEAMGGSIEATIPGIDGRGTRITIALPLASRPISA